MAYSSLGIYIDRGQFNTATPSTVFANHRYENTDDTIATIATDGYFPDYLGEDASAVKVGDLITIQGSNDYRDYKITDVAPLAIVEEVLGDNPFDQSLNTDDAVVFASVALPTTGGTPTALNYHEIGSFNLILSGARTNSVSVSFERIGKLVTLQFATNVGASAANSTIVGSAPIAARLMPATTITKVVSIADNSLQAFGEVEITSGGDIEFGVGAISDNFSASGNCGYYGFPVTYMTA